MGPRSHTDDDEDKEGKNDVEETTGVENGENASAPKKSIIRIAFEIGHRVIGAALIVLSFYNIDSGLKRYSLFFGTDTTLNTVFYGWIGAFLGAVAVATLYSKSLKKD